MKHSLTWPLLPDDSHHEEGTDSVVQSLQPVCAPVLREKAPDVTDRRPASSLVVGGSESLPLTSRNVVFQLLSRVFNRFSTLLRSLGLRILTFIFGSSDEGPKILIRRSRLVAAARCAIHLVPAIVTVALVVLNTQGGYFIGSELQGEQGQDDIKLGLLQLAAKLQELLVISSTAAVIFYAVQLELVEGDGLTLGLLVSGWSFSQVSYFWSPEFWGGALPRNQTSRRKWHRRRLLLLLLFSGMLAVLAGPATAVLMIPTRKDWLVGGGVYWLNGSEAQIWPNDLAADYFSDYDCSSEGARFTDPTCPSAGYQPLYQHYATWWDFPYTSYSFQVQDDNLLKAIYSMPQVKLGSDTWAATTHAATATAQDTIRYLHGEARRYLISNKRLGSPYPNRLEWADSVRYDVETKVPLVRLACLAQDDVDYTTGYISVRFPLLEEHGSFWNDQRTNFSTVQVEATDLVHGYLSSRGLASEEDGPVGKQTFSDVRQLLVVPVDIWNNTGGSLGLILLFDNIRYGYGEEMTGGNAMACSVDARWARGASMIETSPSQELNHEFTRNIARNEFSTKLEIKGSRFLGNDPYKPADDGSLSAIRLRRSWYDVFSPLAPRSSIMTQAVTDPTETNQTTLEKLLQLAYKRDNINEHSTILANSNYKQESEFASIISVAVADSLSRCGKISNQDVNGILGLPRWGIDDYQLAKKFVHQGSPVVVYPKPEGLENAVQQTMTATFTGYVMSAEGVFDYVSLVLLLLHAVLAASHFCWVVYRRRISVAWESILEVIALAYKSVPGDDSILSNTSAGIKSLRTMGNVVYVEVVDGRDSSPSSERRRQESSGEQLRLRIVPVADGDGTVADEDVRSRQMPVPDVLYGKVGNRGNE